MILIVMAMFYLVCFWAYRSILTEWRQEQQAVLLQDQPTVPVPALGGGGGALRPGATGSGFESVVWTALDEHQLTRLLEQAAP